MTTLDCNIMLPSETLSERQIKALPFLVAAPTWEEGRKNAKISRKTLSQWMKNPDFREAFRYLRNSVTERAMNILRNHQINAALKLVGLLETDNLHLRRAVCNDIINHVLKDKELNDIEERLSALERIAMARESREQGRYGNER